MIIVIPTTKVLVSIGYDMSLNMTIKVHFILVLHLTVFKMLLPLNLENNMIKKGHYDYILCMPLKMHVRKVYFKLIIVS